MKHFLNFLYYDDGLAAREIFNGARTIEHLRNAEAFCNVVNGILDPQCDILYKDVCDGDPVTFTTPTSGTTPAPWWDGVADSPSSNAYGFWINEWTGLDGAHMGRSATPSFPRGAVFGPLGQAHRVWKMNVYLFGADDAALQALFRWLEEALLRCCQPGVTAWARTTCPDGYDDDYGLFHVVNLQLLEGIQWLAPPIEQLGCLVREVSFTLGVADPCLYKPPTNCLFDEPFVSNSVYITTTGNDEVAQTGSFEMVEGVAGVGVYRDLMWHWSGYMTDYTPSSEQTLMSHTTGSNPNFGFRIGVNTSGEVRVRISGNGSAYGIDQVSPAPLTDFVANGEWINLRISFVQATGDFTFEYSFDRITYFSMGIVVPFGTLVLAPTTAPFRVGDAADSSELVGAIGHASMYANQLDGDPMVKIIEFEAENFDGGSTYVDQFSAQTWTLGVTGIAVATEDEIDLCGHGLDTIFGCPEDPDAFVDWRLCCPVAGGSEGVTTAVVIIRNNNNEFFSPPMRVVGIQDRGDGCVITNNAYLGEVRVGGIPPQSELMVDCARRRVLWRPVGYIRPWEPGYSYLDPSPDAIPVYPQLACFDGFVIVEPMALTATLLDLQVTVDLVGRYGCC